MRIAVIGAGSWGTALAWLLGQKGYRVWLWGRDAAQIERIAAE
ncbi:MAG: 2-dehydropantoate 2-reductase N-terminal domain-containing protein, partial [Fimbriimonadales bacterium]